MVPTPEFLEAPERCLVALSREYTLDTRHEIPALWNDFWSRDWQFSGVEEQAAFGASYKANPDGSFSYAAGRNIDPTPEQLPEGACRVILSAGRYAVFRNKGPIAELPQLFDAIFNQWLASSSETQREGAVFERYPYEDSASIECMNYEIWLPVAD